MPTLIQCQLRSPSWDWFIFNILVPSLVPLPRWKSISIEMAWTLSLCHIYSQDWHSHGQKVTVGVTIHPDTWWQHFTILYPPTIQQAFTNSFINFHGILYPWVSLLWWRFSNLKCKKKPNHFVIINREQHSSVSSCRLFMSQTCFCCLW